MAVPLIGKSPVTCTYFGVLLSHTTMSPRAKHVIETIEAWAHGGRFRSLVVKLGVTIAGPLVILVGVAMLVLPGPGLVVMALGLALLALEYSWARKLLQLMGKALSHARNTALPKDGTPARRVFGATMIGGFFVVGFLLTTSITALLSAYTFL